MLTTLIYHNLLIMFYIYLQDHGCIYVLRLKKTVMETMNIICGFD